MMSTGRNVLITGGNKGIGLSATEKFINAGQKVYVLARDFAGFPLRDHPQVSSFSPAPSEQGGGGATKPMDR